mmetsp:Transcript_22179/g.50770  ORF Transcript_22179/g.50770 Transcript_22179/m.50770 type:complete len:222 (-) Transcript_22179:2216-2881(-)
MFRVVNQVVGKATFKDAVSGCVIGNVLPYVLRKMWQNGRRGFGKSLETLRQYRLTRPSSPIIRCRDVQSVLGHIQIKVRQVRRGESLQRLSRSIELILLEGRVHLLQSDRQPSQHVFVQGGQVLVWYHVTSGIKVRQVPEEIPRRVTELAVALKGLFDDVVPDADVAGVVDRGHPETEDVGAVGRLLFFVVAPLDDEGRAHYVPKRLGHFVSLFVHNEAVS